MRGNVREGVTLTTDWPLPRGIRATVGLVGLCDAGAVFWRIAMLSICPVKLPVSVPLALMMAGTVSVKALVLWGIEDKVNRPGGGSLQAKHLSEANLAHVRALNEIAKRRGQSLAQLALAQGLRGKGPLHNELVQAAVVEIGDP